MLFRYLTVHQNDAVFVWDMSLVPPGRCQWVPGPCSFFEQENDMVLIVHKEKMHIWRLY